jgi:hypothetical protein
MCVVHGCGFAQWLARLPSARSGSDLGRAPWRGGGGTLSYSDEGNGEIIPAWSHSATLKTVYRIRIRILSGHLIRIRVRIRRAKRTHKNKKNKKFHILKCWMFSFEG